MNIPQLLLEEILLGEKKAEDYFEKYGKEELLSRLEELKKENDAILREYSPDAMTALFEKKAAENKKAGTEGTEPAGKKSSKNIFAFVNSSVVRYAAAAVFVLVLASPLAFPLVFRGRGPAARGLQARSSQSRIPDRRVLPRMRPSPFCRRSGKSRAVCHICNRGR